jgi:mono/diheme cytochrome c family protein
MKALLPSSPILTVAVAVAVALALAVAVPARAADGAAVFMQKCLMCHQSGAVGLPGQFPRLAGRVAVISSAPAGRAYLVDVLTYGMAGRIVVDEQPIIGLMPPFAQLSDDDVAAALSYVQTLGDAPPQPPAAFTPAEVHARRAQPAKTAADVQAERQALQKANLVP